MISAVNRVERNSPAGETVSATTLVRLSDRIAERIGLDFPPEKWPEITRGLSLVQQEFGFSTIDEGVEFLLSADLSREQVEKLSACFTIGETYFFRDPPVFETVRTRIIPEILSRKTAGFHQIRVWSAACSTGEEAYSLAIALTQTLPRWKDWDILILGTDINPKALKKAVAGRYSKWSFRGVSDEVREQYFKPVGNDLCEISPEIREMVSFSSLNLATDTFPSIATRTTSLDLIFCRNVLMYFKPDIQLQVIPKLHQSLSEGGYLFVSATEASASVFPGFQTVQFPSGSGFRRGVPEDVPPAPFGTPSETPSDAMVWEPAPPVPVIVVAPTPDLFSQSRELYRNGDFQAVSDLIISHLPTISKPGFDRALFDDLLELLIHALANRGRILEALEICEGLEPFHRLNPRLYLLKATLQQEQNRIPASIESLRKALYIDHQNIMALFHLGHLQRKKGNQKESQRSFQQARSILEKLPIETILDKAEQLTAGRLLQMIDVVLSKGDQ